jgi:aspartyl protease family protein
VRSDRPLWLVVAALGIAVLALAARHEQMSIAGVSLDSVATIIAGVVLLFMMFGAFSALLYHRIGETIRTAFFWLCFAGVVALVYIYRFEMQSVGERMLALISGATQMQFASGRAVEISRAREGDFNIRAEINGARIPMLVDTGASSVVLTAEAAKIVGLPVEMLKFDVAIETANGRSRAASVVLERVSIGGIVERRVPALVSAPGDLKLSLLGMSFLKRMESIEMRGERLIMRAKQASLEYQADQEARRNARQK